MARKQLGSAATASAEAATKGDVDQQIQFVTSGQPLPTTAKVIVVKGS